MKKLGWLVGDAIIQLDNSGGESSESDGEGTEVIYYLIKKSARKRRPLCV